MRCFQSFINLLLNHLQRQHHQPYHALGSYLMIGLAVHNPIHVIQEQEIVGVMMNVRENQLVEITIAIQNLDTSGTGGPTLHIVAQVNT